MANNLNTITVVGNVTRDPEMRFTPGGTAKVTFGIAVNRSWRNKQTNDWEEQTSFFNVVCWGDLAENVSHSVVKGTRVVATGRLEQRSYETEQGEKRQVFEIVAEEVGPSLRFAVAEVTKTERRGAGEYGGGGGGGAKQPVAAAPAAESYDDYGEEPF